MNFCRTHNDLLRYTHTHTQLFSSCLPLAARTRCTVPTRVAVGLSIVTCIAIMLYEHSQMARSPRKLVRRGAEWGGQGKWGVGQREGKRENDDAPLQQFKRYVKLLNGVGVLAMSKRDWGRLWRRISRNGNIKKHNSSTLQVSRGMRCVEVLRLDSPCLAATRLVPWQGPFACQPQSQSSLVKFTSHSGWSDPEQQREGGVRGRSRSNQRHTVDWPMRQALNWRCKLLWAPHIIEAPE